MGQVKTTLAKLLMLHRAMLLGQIIFAAVALFLRYNNSFVTGITGVDKTLQVVAVVLAMAGFYAGTLLFRKKIGAVRDNSATVKEKSTAYKSACVLQWALLEGPSLFCIVCFLLTGNYAFLALSGALVIFFALMSPSKLKAMLLLRLSEEEMELF